MAAKKAKAKKKAKDKKPTGRPTKRTPAVLAAICERLMMGEPLAAICRDEGMPHPSTVRDWMDADAELSRAIARAREAGEDWLAAECLEIADDARNDWMEKQNQNGETFESFNGEHVQRSKLRIETRLKLLAKFNPKKYGDRVTHAGDPEAPIGLEHSGAVELSPSEAYLRLLNGGA